MTSTHWTEKPSCDHLALLRWLCRAAVLAAESRLQLYFPHYLFHAFSVAQLGQALRLTSLPTARSFLTLRRRPLGWASSAQSSLPHACLRSSLICLAHPARWSNFALGHPHVAGRAALLWLTWLGQAESYPWTLPRLLITRWCKGLLISVLVSPPCLRANPRFTVLGR